MNLPEIIILAVALALDAMVVSFSYGLIVNEKRIKNSLLLACAFGLFQFLMPIIGWFFTNYIYIYIKDYAKWVVFGVFLFLCLKFTYEACTSEEKVKINCISLVCLFGLSVATSIDALGAGISIRMSSMEIIFPSLIIGLITFILSLTGFYSAGFFRKINAKTIGLIAAGLFLYLALKSVI